MTDLSVVPNPLTDLLISKLAREVARNIVPLDRIRDNYMLTQEQFDTVVSTKFFQTRLTEELDIWNASDAMSVSKRIGAKAATMIEESLSEVYALIHDKTMPMTAKVEALKWVSRMAGIGENPAVKGNADDAKVRITINIGDKKIEFDKERLPATVIEGEAVDLTPDSVR
jgi:hypothetical protein